MKLSIITTMYYSAPHLEEFYNRISASAKKVTDDYEIIFVNDGSPDESLDIARGFLEKDKKVRIVDLSRNFGHHKAIVTGLGYARGEKIFIIDCDLEEEPELLDEFYEKFRQEDDCDVVYGIQRSRRGRFFEKISGNLFYFIFNSFSDIKMPPNMGVTRLMSRRYVQSLLRYREQVVFLAGIWMAVGYKQVPILIDKHSRGKSTYTLRKRISLFINAITSFSDKPLRMIFYTGFIISLLAGVTIAYLIIRKLFFATPIPGWTSLTVTIWFLGGLVIFFMGLIGIYLSRVFIETKDRPYTIIKEVYEEKDN
ncbi:MAG: glycosyltransferase family 2 protein [Chloroflexi bacterium]|nr:glycosyltransferase family 2 protein [Chloroflexota bacterium]